MQNQADQRLNDDGVDVLVTGGSGFIGTRLIDHLMEDDCSIVNVDIAPPNKPEHHSFWNDCDILDTEELHGIFDEAHPKHVVHLAAEADTDSDDLEDYLTNTEGTRNVLEAIQGTPSVERVVITSSQFVHYRAAKSPSSDTDFDPHTAYGESKAISERLTRQAELDAIWTIVRPTNVWGPWHPRYPHEFWRVLREGRYVHPGREPVMRGYGYVGNVVWQIEQLLDAPRDAAHGKVYYLGDRPIDLLDYVNGFSHAITDSEVRVVPRWTVRWLAYAGDILKAFGLNAPIHSSRFRSMTEDDALPAQMERTMDVLGEPPYSLEEGIEETTRWLEAQGFFNDVQ